MTLQLDIIRNKLVDVQTELANTQLSKQTDIANIEKLSKVKFGQLAKKSVADLLKGVPTQFHKQYIPTREEYINTISAPYEYKINNLNAEREHLEQQINQLNREREILAKNTSIDFTEDFTTNAVEPGGILIDFDPSVRRFADLGLDRNKYFSFVIFRKTGANGEYYRMVITPNGQPKYSPEAVNSFYWGTINRSYGGADYITYLKLYDLNIAPVDFGLQNGRTLNCVLQAIFETSSSSKDKIRNKLQDKILKYAMNNEFFNDEELHSQPVTKSWAAKIAKAFKLRLIFHSQVGIWYDTDDKNSNRWKQVHLYANKNHASIYVKLGFIEKCEIKSRQELLTLMTELHQPIRYQMSTKMIRGEVFSEIESIQAGNTIYKCYNVPPLYINDPKYFTCTNEIAFEFKRWKLENNIKKLPSPYDQIAKSAWHPMTNQKFREYNKNIPMHLWDQNGAFPNYTCSKYYDRYGLGSGFVRFFINDDDFFLRSPGISYISGVKYHNDFTQKCNPIQVGNAYWHHELMAYIDAGLLDVEISYTMTMACGKDYPHNNIELPMRSYVGLEPAEKYIAKNFNNTFIGKLITGGYSGKFTETYHVPKGYNSERLQLEYELRNDVNIDSVVYDEVTNQIVATKKQGEINQLWHIHGQIVAYQRAEMICTMSLFGPNVIAYCVDGFFTDIEIPLKISDKPFEFKHELKPIKFDSIFYAHVSTPSYIPSYAPNINKYIGRLSPKTNTIGPAGSGKSYVSLYTDIHVGSGVFYPQILQKVSNEAKYLLPTNTIPKDFIPIVDTIQNFLAKINRGDQPSFATIKVDEAHQISEEMKNQLEKFCAEERVNLDLISDTEMIKGKLVLFQRPAPVPCGKPLQSLIGYEWFTQIESTRRQSAEDCKILDEMRIHHAKPYHQLSILLGSEKCDISMMKDNEKQYLPKIFDLVKNGTPIISSAYTRISRLNTCIRDNMRAEYYSAKLPIVHAKLDDNDIIKRLHIEASQIRDNDIDIRAIYRGRKNISKNLIPGQEHNVRIDNVFWDRKSADIKVTEVVVPSSIDTDSKYFQYEPAYARTADSRQGDTIDSKYIIDIQRVGMRGYLYSAASRCKRLSDIHLVKLSDGTDSNLAALYPDLPVDDVYEKLAERLFKLRGISKPSSDTPIIKILSDYLFKLHTIDQRSSGEICKDDELLEIFENIPDDELGDAIVEYSKYNSNTIKPVEAVSKPDHDVQAFFDSIDQLQYSALDENILVQTLVPIPAPKAYKTLTECKEAKPGFYIHTEFPYRHFLAFNSTEDFITWSSSQPVDQRCYHEVCTGEYRRVMVDLDGSHIDPSRWKQLREHCIRKFVDIFNVYYRGKGFICGKELNEEIIVIDSSGLSAQTKKNKFSLQIRAASYVTTQSDNKEFAKILSQNLGDNLVDLGVYTSTHNFRICGSTKLNDNRNSRCVNGWETINTFVEHDCDHKVRLAERHFRPVYEISPIDDALTQQIITAAAPYTKGLYYKFRNGVHTFERHGQTSHCCICEREHSGDNMFITEDAGVINLRCRRDPKTEFELFTIPSL
jgi:hypothetical protein